MRQRLNKRGHPVQRVIYRCGLAALVAMMVAGMVVAIAPLPSVAQNPFLKFLQPTQSATETEQPAEGEEGEPASPDFDIDVPAEFENLLRSTEPDDVARAPVRLDGRTLFQVAEQTERINERLAEIEARLANFVAEDYDPETLEVNWEWTNNFPVLYAIATIDGEQVRQELLTVTVLDAQRSWYGDSRSLEERLTQTADSWSVILENALIRYKQERQIDYLSTRGQIAGGILIAMIVLSMGMYRSLRLLRARQRRTNNQLQEISQQLANVSTEDTVTRIETRALVQQETRLRQQQSVNSLKKRLIQLGLFALWFGGILLILGLFPYSRWLQPLLIQALRIPGELLIVAIVTYLLIRVDDILVNRLFSFLQESPQLLTHGSQRRMLRFSTFSSVTKSISGFLIGSIGFVTGLSILGVNVAPLIAGAGIIGLAVSFAAQNLIRDIINGFLILMEDQYGVGDVVVIGDVAGFVENMGLRITQLRNEEGRLITVPNGTITVVQNLTKEWSRVDLMIDVAHTSDLDQAIAVIKRVAEEMTADAYWRSLILESPMLLGVDKLDHVGATVRLWIKTLPLKQWDVAREYRRRLKYAFDRAGVTIGVPQQSIRFGTALNLDQPNLSTNPNPSDEPTPTVDI